MFTHIADGLTHIADGFTHIADGFTRIADGFTRIADGFTRIADGFAHTRGRQARVQDPKREATANKHSKTTQRTRARQETLPPRILR